MWWCRVQKNSVYIQGTPAACRSADRSYRVRSCSSLPLLQSTPTLLSIVHHSPSDTHPASTFSLYTSLSGSCFTGTGQPESALPAATRLASRDARITALVFLLRFPRRMAGIGKTKEEKARIRARRMYRVNGYV